MEEGWRATGLVLLLPLGTYPHPGSAGVQDEADYQATVLQFKAATSWRGEYLVNRQLGSSFRCGCFLVG